MEVRSKSIAYRPNPQPLPYKGRGVRLKASLVLGERFGERSKSIAYKRKALYNYLFTKLIVLENSLWR